MHMVVQRSMTTRLSFRGVRGIGGRVDLADYEARR